MGLPPIAIVVVISIMIAGTGIMRIISMDAKIQGHYERCLLQGTSETLAEMFAFGQPPASNTDREFLQGHCNGNQFEKNQRFGDLLQANADAAGINIKGAVYESSLADYPGDPSACVWDRADIRRKCEQDGRSCRGVVNYRPPAPISEPKDMPLADDIVSNKVAEIVSGLPESDRPHVDTLDLAQQVREVMSPHWV